VQWERRAIKHTSHGAARSLRQFTLPAAGSEAPSEVIVEFLSFSFIKIETGAKAPSF
jgi:hypothetical protein